MKARISVAFLLAALVCGVSVPGWTQIRALLPDISEVAAQAPTPIDGVWRLELNGAEFRIEAGRAYAVTPYTHLFVFNVEPGMVTTREIVRVAPGRYEGNDLPTLGPWKAELRSDRSLSVTVNGPLGPLKMTPVQFDDPAWLERELALIGGGTAPREPAPVAESIYPPGWEAR